MGPRQTFTYNKIDNFPDWFEHIGSCTVCILYTMGLDNNSRW